MNSTTKASTQGSGKGERRGRGRQKHCSRPPTHDTLLNLKMAARVYVALVCCLSASKSEKEEREMSDGEQGEELPVCVCTLHTEARKSNCLLNTSEVKGWLGMQGVVAQPAVISLQKRTNESPNKSL